MTLACSAAPSGISGRSKVHIAPKSSTTIRGNLILMSVSIFWCLARHWDTASTWHLKTNVLQNLRFRSARSMLGLPMLGRKSSLETLKISADLQTGDAQNIVLCMNLPYPGIELRNAPRPSTTSGKPDQPSQSTLG